MAPARAALPPARSRWRVVCPDRDRKSTRLNSSHLVISYAVFCLKKKKKNEFNCFPFLSNFSTNNFFNGTYTQPISIAAVFVQLAAFSQYIHIKEAHDSVQILMTVVH